VEWAVTKLEKKATNPYRPSVGAMTTDNTPLVIKGGEEFPARSGDSWLRSQVEPEGQGESHKYAIYDVPELHERLC
jgi:hypothetical protein